MNKDSPDQQFLRIALIAVGVLLLIRVFPALWGSLAFALIVGLILAVAYLLYRRFGNRDATAARDSDPFAARIREQMETCHTNAATYREEADNIRISHRKLADQLDKSTQQDSSAHHKALRILSDLDAELSLRLAKANFFEESEKQLQDMLEARLLHQQLVKSESELEKWRSANYDDLAQMESMKERIERDKAQLDTISELTHRAAVSQDLNHTEKLRLKLKDLYS